MAIKTSNKIILALAVVAVGLLVIRFLSPEDTWLCQNGQWVKHGQPSVPMPISGCGGSKNQDAANTIYIIEGKAVTLLNGQATEPIAGSDSKSITKIFSVAAAGDLNGDNVPDAAVILTQDNGGSGTFYYIAAAIKNENGYSGTNAVLLGDRVAPENGQIKDGTLIVNYADRKPGEDFSIQPSVAKSMYLNFLHGTLISRPEAIMLSSPYPYQEIASPLTISGQARGTWFFEASFPVILTDWDGVIIAQGTAQAKADWMTQNFVPFVATLQYKKPSYKNTGTLILKKDNPSGLPQNDQALEIPVIFK